ncbi:DNA ligase [Reinekea thalattae]|uniref:DNA ligase n=1 Tax=Reinekea thalattae TaxID=2593301 RepID=A0A5C8Z3M2_9GAMM|nr:DNA ligase [Reinekea thalattae]TXR52147.1 DNA ligase [Reinekea thalattae]
MQTILMLLIVSFLLLFPIVSVAAQNGLALMHAKQSNVAIADFSQYQVTEKYDGVRVLWHKGVLSTRSGNRIAAPAWFLAALPELSLEGELWLGYGQFDQVSSLVRSHSEDDERWQSVSLMVFDLPMSLLPYQQRYQLLEQLVTQVEQSWFQRVAGYPVNDQRELTNTLAKVVAAGGEGLMLNQRDALYQPVRSDAIIKLKPKYDAEAEVIGYSPGKGKYQGMMGALIVRDSDGRRFKVGTGFSDAERAEPPKIGQWISYQYSGQTSTGLPRFPSFLRLYQAL